MISAYAVSQGTKAPCSVRQTQSALCDCLQVVQLDPVVPQAEAAADAKPSSVVDVIELMAAVLEDSPSNRLTMLQTSGNTSIGHVLDHLQTCWV